VLKKTKNKKTTTTTTTKKQTINNKNLKENKLHACDMENPWEMIQQLTEYFSS